ncbi:MAG: hypothetical protein L0H84_24365 [Pseudonocardia sp.]|nr:hypothetical protein [Pseudonocardia sp.]
MSPADQCNYCAAPLRWALTAAGKRMPLDAAPDAQRGNVLLLGGRAAVLGPGPARGARSDGQTLYLPHAVFCPHARHWSTKKPARRRPSPAQAGRRR